MSDREQQAEAVWSATEGLPPEEQPDLTGSALSCAVCSGKMQRLLFSATSGFVVDRCEPHGMWFDRNELRRAAEALLASRPLPPTNPSPVEPAAPRPPDLAQEGTPATTARCESCGRPVDPAQADLSGTGYRCLKCTVGAQVAGHYAASVAHQQQQFLQRHNAWGFEDSALISIVALFEDF